MVPKTTRKTLWLVSFWYFGEHSKSKRIFRIRRVTGLSVKILRTCAVWCVCVVHTPRIQRAFRSLIKILFLLCPYSYQPPTACVQDLIIRENNREVRHEKEPITNIFRKHDIGYSSSYLNKIVSPLKPIKIKFTIGSSSWHSVSFDCLKNESSILPSSFLANRYPFAEASDEAHKHWSCTRTHASARRKVPRVHSCFLCVFLHTSKMVQGWQSSWTIRFLNPMVSQSSRLFVRSFVEIRRAAAVADSVRGGCIF